MIHSINNSSALPGLHLTEHIIEVPLDHNNPADNRHINIFARVVRANKPNTATLPYILYLQGGPGFPGYRPTAFPSNPPWINRAIEQYQVVFLDQRGTGKSTPISVPHLPAEQMAEYMTHFRADEIVADCEDIRIALGATQWSVLGQSFGGFSTLTYLSKYPDSLTEVFFTGGISAINTPLEEVYSCTYATLAEKSARHYQYFPEDKKAISALLSLANAQEIFLPDGTMVTASMLRSLGTMLGASGGHERLHWLLDLPVDSTQFLHQLAQALPFSASNPIYYVLHESCYADGFATNWTAERILPEVFQADQTLLTGEHVFSDWLDHRQGYAPWKETALLLAQHKWPRLYDEQVLSQVKTRGAAAVYVDDAYVPLHYSCATGNMMSGVQLWITNEMEHNGLNAAGSKTIDRLIQMANQQQVLY